MAAGEGPVKLEDVAGVRSRVSWQAIIAGAIAALATNLVLILFFAAIGITLTESGVRANAVGSGELIAILFSLFVSLFVGGWFATQLTAGETQREAVLYGILTWATVVATSVFLSGLGLGSGYFAVMRGAIVVQEVTVVQAPASGAPNATNAANAAPTQQQLDAARQRAEAALVAASWIALVGVLLGLGCCIGGALVGRGATLRLFQPTVQVEERRELIIP
jgi:hypothetical protein